MACRTYPSTAGSTPEGTVVACTKWTARLGWRWVLWPAPECLFSRGGRHQIADPLLLPLLKENESLDAVSLQVFPSATHTLRVWPFAFLSVVNSVPNKGEREAHVL